MTAQKPRILYCKPSITELESRLATDAVANGWGDRCYEYIHRFEKMFCEHLGVSYAIATSSCTGAMHMGFSAMGLGAGDEVILADSNWVASVAPLTYLGVRPVFVDILPDSWCLDPTKVELAITPKTRAILAVHLYGNTCAMDRLLEIGARHGIPVIEDAAEAIGSSIAGKAAGSLGLFGVFSFHGSKTLTTGEGGMFVTNDKALFERVETLSNHGRARGQSKQFWPDQIGFKYKISNIQAALGVAQLSRASELIGRKREILAYYRAALKQLPLSMNPEPTGTQNGAWMPTLVFDPKTGVRREHLQKAFAEENIDARVFFWPLSSLPAFQRKEENQFAYSIPERAINLPSYHDITTEQLDRVIDVVTNVLKQHGSRQ